jgi:hypothetical protein
LTIHVLYGRAPSPRAEVHLPTKIQTAVLATYKSETTAHTILQSFKYYKFKNL